MPWEELSVSEQRRLMIRKWESGLYSVRELAAEFGVSRPVVYKWIERYLESGGNLNDRPPIPGSCPHRTEQPIVDNIIAAKQQYPRWGPKKLIDYLWLEKPEIAWPSSTAAGRHLDQAGLVEKRRPRRNSIVRRYVTGSDTSESGDMMTGDHKGQIRLTNGKYSYPVTICDPVSKYIYAIDGRTSTSAEEAKQSFEKVFREYGLPRFILTDNGHPFSCSRSLGALSTLAVWWVRLGITPLTIHKGCPWENGSHERKHKDLKAATTRPPSSSMSELQKRFDFFRHEFNRERPHETLGGRRPIDFLKHSTRSFPRKLAPIQYPGHYETRAVQSKGFIKWQGSALFIGNALAGQRIGLEESDDGIWTLYFSSFELGRYDERTNRVI